MDNLYRVLKGVISLMIGIWLLCLVIFIVYQENEIEFQDYFSAAISGLLIFLGIRDLITAPSNKEV